MRILPVVTALLVGVLTHAPVAAQDKPSKPSISEAQKKEAEEKLQELLKGLRAIEEQQAAEARKAAEEAKKSADAARRAFEEKRSADEKRAEQLKSAATAPNDPRAALEGLMKSSDPKVATLAKELLNALPKQAPPVAGGPVWEFKHAQPSVLTPMKRIVVVDSTSANPKAGEPGTAGGSTLKLSADGKTAAVVGADGTITIYDVASGKEQMKFAGRK